MELYGIITWVGEETKKDGPNGTWSRQDIVIEHGNIANPKKAALTLGTKKLHIYDGTPDGKIIEPHIGMRGTFVFDLEARNYTKDGASRWFNNVICWSFKPDGQTAEQSGTEQGNANDDDLAF